jgi:hypothetical protein
VRRQSAAATALWIVADIDRVQIVRQSKAPSPLRLAGALHIYEGQKIFN